MIGTASGSERFEQTLPHETGIAHGSGATPQIMIQTDRNQSNHPVGYLLTFRCYGTWLPGDERGSTDEFCNEYGTPFHRPNEKWNKYARAKMKQPPVRLNRIMRGIVGHAVIDVCDVRNWVLHAQNVRTNHVHVVITTGDTDPTQALIALKANATRMLREHGLWKSEFSPWSKKGSKRYLWRPIDVEFAVEYVKYRQGGDISNLD